MAMTHPHQLTARVRKGAEWLDQMHPGWATRIDPTTLDLRNETSDVLSQVMGISYFDAIAAAAHMPSDYYGPELEIWAQDHGFNAEALHDADYDALKALWVAAAEERL